MKTDSKRPNSIKPAAISTDTVAPAIATAWPNREWVNLLLVVMFAVRRGFFAFDRAFVISLLKFAVVGLVLALCLWLASRWSQSALAGVTSFRDEIALGILVAVGAVVYGASVLLLFGRRWLTHLIRPRAGV